MKKTALCIGINDYPGTGSDLAGCVNDAKDWAAELDRRGFACTTMLDENATKDAMLAGMSKLIEAAEPGDTVVITYSGHGTWVPDEDGDEADLRDEALCPYDIFTVGALTDDELFEVFSARKRGTRAVLVSDSCHSGTVNRLAPSLGDDTSRVVRFLPPETFLSEQLLSLAARAETAPVTGRPRRGALVMAGCRATEFSYDASFEGRPNGAFTYVALDTLRHLDEKATYRDWQRLIRQQLPSANYPQTPQLNGTRFQRGWEVLA